jgi:hypothetical protein
MSNYVQSTNFATKDALPSGDPLKIVKGTEINTEFNNISTAITTKADLASPTFTGTPTLPTGTIGVTQSAGNNSTALATTAFVAAALQSLYPVGSIYINAGSATNPATLLGFGTWTAFGAGRVMVGLNGSDTLFDALEETGGSKDATVVSHTHTINDPGHAHTYTFKSTIGGDSGGLDPNSIVNSAASTGVATTGISVNSAGSSGTNANLQPYITVAMWKRTA